MNISKIQKELNEALKILLEDDNEKKETTLLFGEDLSKNVSELYQKVKKVFSGETEDASIDGIKISRNKRWIFRVGNKYR